jgi:hypothetical protein
VATQPSLVFSVFESVQDPRYDGWVRFRDAISTGIPFTDRSTPPAPIVSCPIGLARPAIWRLLASNHREIGRSWSAYSTFDAARGHVLELQQRVAELDVVVIRDARAGRYGWIASLRGKPVITAGRWFGASSASSDSAAVALAALRDDLSWRPCSPS